jgi:hypothetical protein
MQRRSFLKNAVLLGSSVALVTRGNGNPLGEPLDAAPRPAAHPLPGKRIGIIGLDTSHSVEFTKVLNSASADGPYKGYRVTAAYPYGSLNIASSYNRIPGYIEKVKACQVAICSSLDELLDQVDCVLLETNDGHLRPEQATKVFQSRKPVFIDKPLGANLKEVEQVYKAAAQYDASFFTSSALRYTTPIMQIRAAASTPATPTPAAPNPGKVLGASCFSPCTIEPTHEDLYWYGIHGVEMLFAVMGPGCKTVQAAHTADTDMAVGIWEDGRIGTFRGTRTGVNAFGGIVFGEQHNIILGDYEGYEGLLKAIIDYFASGQVPVPIQETREIYAFMSAFQKSRQHHGKPIPLEHF